MLNLAVASGLAEAEAKTAMRALSPPARRTMRSHTAALSARRAPPTITSEPLGPLITGLPDNTDDLLAALASLPEMVTTALIGTAVVCSVAAGTATSSSAAGASRPRGRRHTPAPAPGRAGVDAGDGAERSHGISRLVGRIGGSRRRHAHQRAERRPVRAPRGTNMSTSGFLQIKRVSSFAHPTGATVYRSRASRRPPWATGVLDSSVMSSRRFASSGHSLCAHHTIVIALYRCRLKPSLTLPTIADLPWRNCLVRQSHCADLSVE